MKTKTSTYTGFTLIELLVVVLIIGILSSIALPQYQKAVLKSRLATMMNNVKSITMALEEYYLANGQYPSDDVSGLSLEITGCTTSASSGIFTCKNAIYDYQESTNSQQFGGFLTNFNGLGYVEWGKHAKPAEKAGTRECWADSSQTTPNKVCESMGGVKTGTKSWRTSSSNKHTHAVWNTYRLP